MVLKGKFSEELGLLGEDTVARDILENQVNSEEIQEVKDIFKLFNCTSYKRISSCITTNQ